MKDGWVQFKTQYQSHRIWRAPSSWEILRDRRTAKSNAKGIFTSVHKLRIISSKKDKTEVENKNNIRHEEVIILAQSWRDNYE